MNRFSSPLPAPSGEHPIEHRSVATLAAALVTCQHPELCRISATVGVGGESRRISWCTLCGALGSEQTGAFTWQPSTLASLLTKGHFEELATLLHAIRSARALADAALSRCEDGAARELDDALSRLTKTAIVRDLERLDDALAQMPPPPSTPSFP